MQRDIHNPDPPQGALSEIAECARRYCGMIESVGEADSSWLHEMSRLLSRLHHAVEALERTDHSMHAIPAPDLEARFELFSHLRGLLGTQDDYALECDLVGSLADDLTDIYCEMKHGLRLFEQEPSLAAVNWRSGYHLHWGQHLLDAARHLLGLHSRFHYTP